MMQFSNILILVVLVSVFEYSNAQAKCRDHDNNAGTCLPYDKCKSLSVLLNKGLLSKDEVNSLKLSCTLPLLCCADSLPENNDKLLPDSKSCSPPFFDNKISNGNESKIGEFAWMALIEYGDEKTLNCGGSLINERYILTAAHCVSDRIKRRYGAPTQIRLGEHNTATPKDCFNNVCNDEIVQIGIEEIIPHESYDITTRHNDIALIRLSHAVKYTYYIHPICMPSVLNLKKSTEGTNVTVAGWGGTLNETRSNIKLKITIPIYNQNSCAKKYNDNKIKIIDKQLCAGGQTDGPKKDSCTGDSGGPLMTLIDNKYVLEGIISYGGQCERLENFPGIYTRVADYETWIRSHIRK